MYPDSKNRKFIMIDLVCNLTPNVTLLLHFFEVAHIGVSVQAHMDRSICIIGIDLSHIGVPTPHIRIDLSALSG